MAIKKVRGTGKSIPLDPKTADNLLELLSTDNAFRRLYRKDPLAALAKAGHQPAADAIALLGCCTVKDALATKSELSAARSQLKAYLTSAAIYTNPHAFDAGKMPSNLRRK
jgi:putative modified peptide